MRGGQGAVGFLCRAITIIFVIKLGNKNKELKASIG